MLSGSKELGLHAVKSAMRLTTLARYFNLELLQKCLHG